MDISNEELIQEIDRSIDELYSLLPDSIEGKNLSNSSKLPYKLTSINYSFCYRFYDIANSALNLIKLEKYLPSSILIRSLMETAAMLFFVENKIEKYLTKFNTKEVDEFLMKILLGNKLYIDEFIGYNCLNAIDKVNDIKYNKFREMYNQLSEFAHPNWAGSAGYFSKIETEGYKRFINNEGINNTLFILFPFAISISLLMNSHSSIIKMMPQFIKLCENEN